jgi:hypothetical protein
MSRPLVGRAALVDTVLSSWGDTVGVDADGRVGWASESIIYRMIRQGPGAAQTGAGAPSMPDQMVAVDKAVRAVKKAITRRCLRQWYAPKDRRHRENQTICAREAGLSARRFRHHLTAGREEVADILGLASESAVDALLRTIYEEAA